MKATDFNFEKELRFNPDTGITTFRDSRMVIFDAKAMGLLRQTIVKAIGPIKARRLFLRFGFQCGFADFMQMKLNFQFDSEQELLASGPVIHTYEGIVQADPTEIRLNRETGEFYFTGIWSNSYEAEQYSAFNETAEEPVCWSLMGYASGWCTGFFGKPLIAIEPKCMGKGDAFCEWKIQPPSVWGAEAEPYLKAYGNLLQK